MGSKCTSSLTRLDFISQDNEIFYINVKYNPKAIDLAEKFTVHEVHNLPFQYAAMLVRNELDSSLVSSLLPLRPLSPPGLSLSSR